MLFPPLFRRPGGRLSKSIRLHECGQAVLARIARRLRTDVMVYGGRARRSGRTCPPIVDDGGGRTSRAIPPTSGYRRRRRRRIGGFCPPRTWKHVVPAATAVGPAASSVRRNRTRFDVRQMASYAIAGAEGDAGRSRRRQSRQRSGTSEGSGGIIRNTFGCRFAAVWRPGPVL